MTDEGYQLPEPLGLLHQAARQYIQKESVPLQRELAPDACELPREEYECLQKLGLA